MILNTSSKIQDNGKDYLLLLDYGREGIVVYSQHETLTDAIIGALDKKSLGLAISIVKVCRIDDPVETK